MVMDGLYPDEREEHKNVLRWKKEMEDRIRKKENAAMVTLRIAEIILMGIGIAPWFCDATSPIVIEQVGFFGVLAWVFLCMSMLSSYYKFQLKCKLESRE